MGKMTKQSWHWRLESATFSPGLDWLHSLYINWLVYLPVVITISSQKWWSDWGKTKTPFLSSVPWEENYHGDNFYTTLPFSTCNSNCTWFATKCFLPYRFGRKWLRSHAWASLTLSLKLVLSSISLVIPSAQKKNVCSPAVLSNKQRASYQSYHCRSKKHFNRMIQISSQLTLISGGEMEVNNASGGH